MPRRHFRRTVWGRSNSDGARSTPPRYATGLCEPATSNEASFRPARRGGRGPRAYLVRPAALLVATSPGPIPTRASPVDRSIARLSLERERYRQRGSCVQRVSRPFSTRTSRGTRRYLIRRGSSTLARRPVSPRRERHLPGDRGREGERPHRQRPHRFTPGPGHRKTGYPAR
jgi:hypothetical protein